jgi:TRAP-type C4-dicarboxylate transport system permease small subunit
MSVDQTAGSTRSRSPSVPVALRALGTAMAAVAGAGVVVLMLLTVVDVLLRQSGGQGLGFTLEVTEVVLVAVVFAGMTSAQLSRSHVQTPILTDRLPPRWAAVARFVGLAIAVALTAWMTVATLRAGLTSFHRGEFRFGLVRFPVWPAKLIIPVGVAGFTLVLLSECVGAARAVLRGFARPSADDSTHPDERP